MSVKLSTEKVASINYAANQTVRERLNPARRYVWDVFLLLRGTWNVTVLATHAITRAPGTLFDLRLMLNNALVLAEGHAYSWLQERALLNGVVPTVTGPAVGVAAYPLAGTIRIPCAHPWLRTPSDTVLDMARERRLDLHIAWNDGSALTTGGTAAFTVDPVVDVVCITSDDAPPGAAQGYAIQRELETGNLGAVANTDLQIQLPVGRDHNYLGMVLGAQNTVANTGRALVATALNQILLEMRGAGGHTYAVGPVSGNEVANIFTQVARHPDKEEVGCYPIPLVGGAGGGLVAQAVQTGDATDLRLRINHAAFAAAGVITVNYDVYSPKLAG